MLPKELVVAVEQVEVGTSGYTGSPWSEPVVVCFSVSAEQVEQVPPVSFEP